MLSKRFKDIFTTDRLLNTLELYKKTKGYKEAKELIKSGEFLKQLKKGYIPDPLQGFEIEKSDGGKRQLANATITSKVVQKIIATELLESVKFNNKSYAFRPNKGTLKAINRTKDFLIKYKWIAKADIDNFFDTINQKKLLTILNRIIIDKKIIALIALFLKNGMLKEHHWVDKEKGVYQGDVLSPVLSNIYLHTFDEALEKEGIDFVRYADDMVFFAKSKKEAKKNLAKAAAYLKALDLSFGEDKSYISSLEDGFEFLGLRFKGDEILMDNEKFQKKLSKISKNTKKRNLQESIEFLNEYLQGIKNYYAKVLSSKHQLILIGEHIDEILIRKIANAKRKKIINKKGKFFNILLTLEDLQHTTTEEKQRHANMLIDRAYELLAQEKPLKSAEKKIAKKKREFLKEQIKASEIILNAYGLYVSVNRGKIVVKEYGKVVQKSPINWISRIIVMSKGVSFSSNLIWQCSKRKIDIDFINQSIPYAQITYHNTISNELHLKQLDIKNSSKGLEIAKAIIKAKMRNQINLVKYYARYREKENPKEYQELQKNIDKMEAIFKNLKKAQKQSTLMGLEGSLSNIYWQCFGILIDKPNFKRVTLDAPDTINQALNYGYAFIYHRVQSALLKTGINIYQSFLHSEQPNKPTLVYDLVEPFRQLIVDREIISILNRGTKLNSSKGKLDKKSVKVITQNIQERLATPTKWRKGKYKLTTIIDEQALELAHVVKGIKSKFKGFVGRF